MPRAHSDNETRLLAYLAAGIRSSEEIQKRLGLSQATVSRLITALKDEIVVIGRARSRRYTLRRDVRGLGGDFPVFSIDPEGNATSLGILAAIGQDAYLWQPKNGEAVASKSLPWFLADLRPDGFTGRAFVRRLHEDLAMPPRVLDWHDDHVLAALSRRGEEFMGDLIVGRESLDRYFRLTRDSGPPIPQEELPVAYPELAGKAMDGQPVGSSAGGEQPKFTACIERGGEVLNVLVKFSPPVEAVEGRRWADLLVCEHIALQVVQEQGIPAAKTTLLQSGGRLFLEVVRFDRVGRFGRLPMVSLRAIDNEFYGRQDNWAAAAKRMEADHSISREDAGNLRWLSFFGDLIANTDQHFGNISLAGNAGRYRLLPAYDMLPMFYRPMDGAAPVKPFRPPAFATAAAGEWDSALRAALDFWGRAGDDQRISQDFRAICRNNLEIVRDLETGPRLVG
jgi:DNA-binding CsgD family transcriptional regulator